MAVDWNVVSAVSSAVAAIAALGATGIAAWSGIADRRARQRDKVEQHYDRWVVTPARESITVFIDSARPILDSGAGSIQSLCGADTAHSKILDALASTMSEFDEEFFKLKGSLTLRVQALNDSELSDMVRENLENLQDAVSVALDKHSARNESIDFGAVIGTHASALLQNILEHVEKRTKEAETRGWRVLTRSPSSLKESSATSLVGRTPRDM